MCRRYYRQASKQAILEHFAATACDIDLAATYNIAPQSTQPVIRLDHSTNSRELAKMRWGLVPSWSLTDNPNFSTINAREEKLVTNPLFRSAFKRRRCLIPASGFYAWKGVEQMDSQSKQPYAIGLKVTSLVAFAGVWDCWNEPATGKLLETFTIVTTRSNMIVAPIYNRMPVILGPRDYARWLEPGNPTQPPTELLRPYKAEEMKAWPISKAVEDVRNDWPTLVEPIGDTIPGG